MITVTMVRHAARSTRNKPLPQQLECEMQSVETKTIESTKKN